MDTPIGQIFATGEYVGALLKGLGDILGGPLHLDSQNCLVNKQACTDIFVQDDSLTHLMTMVLVEQPLDFAQVC